MPVLTLIPLFARLIEIISDLNFPPFSGDGKYLKLGSVADMEEVLGSPEDDSLNTESSPGWESEEFLETVQREERDLIEYFSDAEQRQNALSQADAYGSEMFQLVHSVARPERLRYLVV